ncbi:hypothetical protein DL765_002241 [Monosporascus sp. GIB2]|nr:hypothetical protein DL765_002241 [Monosporascus sp. GIB2]
MASQMWQTSMGTKPWTAPPRKYMRHGGRNDDARVEIVRVPGLGNVFVQYALVVLEDKETYFSSVKNAYSLQDWWKKELRIDILERIAHSLREASGIEVRLTHESERDYFAGVIRAINTGIQIHADFAAFTSVPPGPRSQQYLVGMTHPAPAP